MGNSGVTSQPKAKKTKPPAPQISLVDQTDDEDEIAENAEDVENEDPDESTADKRRRIAASRLKVSVCSLQKHHCYCAEFDGCHGCGKCVNMTQSDKQEDWECIVHAERYCHLSDNYNHCCIECQDNIPRPSTSNDFGVIMRCPFPFMGFHCACESCCGCGVCSPPGQQCLDNGARLCEISSYNNHSCCDCYDYCSDTELLLMLN